MEIELTVTGKEEVWARDQGFDTTFWVLKLAGIDGVHNKFYIKLRIKKEDIDKYAAGSKLIFKTPTYGGK